MAWKTFRIARRNAGTRTLRPVSGLASGSILPGPSPSRARNVTQWLHDEPQLAYRCGGSTGIALTLSAPVSRVSSVRTTPQGGVNLMSGLPGVKRDGLLFAGIRIKVQENEVTHLSGRRVY